MADGGGERNRRDQEARTVNKARRRFGASDNDGDHAQCEQSGGAGQRDRQCHDASPFSRTPRPPALLAALSAMSSMPSESRAATSFISESTLPRITPSLASMRWIVGSDNPAASARVR